jgi:predicted short-subunit dehydrogenase-like oxidoreductase (DUF2520 family)
MTSFRNTGTIIIGGGRAGAALAWYFLQNKLHPLTLIEKNTERRKFLESKYNWEFIKTDLSIEIIKETSSVFLAVPDDAIVPLSGELIRLPIPWNQKLVVHLSGALSRTVLEPFQERGSFIASFHPILSFAKNPHDNIQLQDAWIDIETDPATYHILEQLLWFHKDRFFSVNATDKLKIHLASVFFSNFLAALSETGLEVFGDMNFLQAKPMEIFSPLIDSTLKQIEKGNSQNAITGPARRGDLETIKKHIDWLRSHDPEKIKIYQVLTEKILALQKSPSKRQNMILDYLKNL